MMQFIQNTNTTIKKEMNNLEALKELILEDKRNKDYKSLNYHTMAFEGTLQKIKELETKV